VGASKQWERGNPAAMANLVDGGGRFYGLLGALHVFEADHAEAKVPQLTEETAVGEPKRAR